MAQTENHTDNQATEPAASDLAVSAAQDAEATEAKAEEAIEAKAEEATEAKAEDATEAKADDAADPTGDGEGDESVASSAPELPEGEMSFAEMFELAEKESREKKKLVRGLEAGGLRPGRVVEAKIVGFSHDSVFVDFGGKAEGVMPKADLLNDDGEFELKEGDSVEGRVVSLEGGTVKLGKVTGADSVRNREAVKQAFEAGTPVEGRVTGKNKGGLEVLVGGLRAFCPISQIDTRFHANVEDFVGQKLTFKITEFKNNGRNVVVSRRTILEEERRRKAAETIGRLSVGQTVIGQVISLKDYGAFVDVGGVEGLVHVSEITHSRIRKPSEKLSVGQQMDVQIIKIEEGKGGNPKISLSMKVLEKDPWSEAQLALREGMKVTGTVQRIQPFGAFVEIMPGVDGLIHVSNMSNERISNPRDILKEGDSVDATVVTLDWKKRRIGLSMVKTRQELAKDLSRNQVLEGTIDKIESFGLFVKLPSGARGLVPLPETGTARGADLTKEFSAGQTVKVQVLETDRKTGRIRLSIKGAAAAEERAMYASYMGTESTGRGLGTLGDLFRDKFGK